MSTTTKTQAAKKQNPDMFIRPLPGKKQLKLNLAIDLEQMLDLVEATQSIDDDDDVFTTMMAVRKIMPEEFMTQVKGVDAVISLGLFMEYVQLLGERLGKALTTPAD